jgi:hypothetical protein
MSTLSSRTEKRASGARNNKRNAFSLRRRIDAISNSNRKRRTRNARLGECDHTRLAIDFQQVSLPHVSVALAAFFHFATQSAIHKSQVLSIMDVLGSTCNFLKTWS